jgi:Mor family transcriptional regulator
MSKITQEIAQKIIWEFCEGQSTYDLADKYRLWQTSVCNIINGRTWSKCIRPENISAFIKERQQKKLV